MATSKIAVCNLALSMLGEETISSFSDNNSRARLCDNLYEQARDTVLGLFDWPFARGFVQIQEKADVVLPDGVYAYGTPTDMITPRDIHPRGKGIWWELSGQNIHVYVQKEQFLYYTRKETNPNNFSSLFISTMAELLASWLAFPLTGDKQLADSKSNVYAINLSNTLAVEANIGTEYRRSDERPENDSFNNADYVDPNVANNDWGRRD